ncbi:MAG: helix-turn-helix domain-containing protein [Acidobacteriota bacterium]|uniref:Putative DNA binding, helix-turn-helix domain containing protein n=1 Tax=viral metagenome TaxID=1070528 RepID=A0A6M3L520_9ZZZZ
MNKSSTSITQIEQALRKSGGLCSGAAQLLGLTRQAVSERVRKSKRLQAALVDIEETTLDLGESKLISAINKGNMTAIIFYLKTKGKKRGYVERNEVTGKDGQDLAAPVVTIYIPDNGRTS